MSICPSVYPSVRMEQLGSHWPNIHEILCLSIFRNSAENIQLLLKSNTNNESFTQRPMYIYQNISQFLLGLEMFQA